MENCQNCFVRGERNKELRKLLKQAQEQADGYFTALCNVDTTAQAAMEELWTAGGLECGPEDYDIIVEFALTAIRGYKERHQAPLQYPFKWNQTPHIPEPGQFGTLVVDPSVKWQYVQNVGVQNNPTACTSE